MNQSTSKLHSDKKPRVPGEPYVWFTSMGLAVGLMMVVCLVGVIIFSGLNVFWPKPIVQVILSSPMHSASGDIGSFLGEISKKQQKAASIGTRESDPALGQGEWQLFVGNREISGLSFAYLDEANIREVTYPKDVMMIERLEYGRALGYPLRLELGQDRVVFFEDSHFNRELRQTLRLTVARWNKIKHLEKAKIGAINSEIENLHLSKKKLIAETATASAEERVAAIDGRISEIQREYEQLAAQARVLRDRQDDQHFVFRTEGGREVSLPMGHMVRFYYPNRLNVFSRTALFVSNIWKFLTQEPREANTEGGIFPAIFGTFVMTIMMSVAVTPFGVLAAIYLREYARQGKFVRAVRIGINNLAGVPSIVFGVFGLGFFVYLVGAQMDQVFFADKLPTPTFGTGGILWASLTLALMTVPVVIVATEEALAAVPRGAREGSLACGASKWQTIQRIVLPASAPGIITGFILAAARGAGEVAPLMLVGVVKLAPTLPLDGVFPFLHMERKFMHLGFHIYDLGFQSPDSEAAKPMVFATALVLIALVLLLNIVAIQIRTALRKKFAEGTF